MTKDKLLAEVTRSRAAIARDYAATRVEMDFKAKAERMVRKNPLAWIGGAASLGWILAGPKKKTKVVTKTVKAGATPAGQAVKETAARTGAFAAVVGLMKLAFPVVRPIIMAYAGRRLTELAERLAK